MPEPVWFACVLFWVGVSASYRYLPALPKVSPTGPQGQDILRVPLPGSGLLAVELEVRLRFLISWGESLQLLLLSCVVHHSGTWSWLYCVFTLATCLLWFLLDITSFAVGDYPASLYVSLFSNCSILLLCVCAQSCLTLCDPTDYSPPGSPVHGIFQVRILEQVSISYSRVVLDSGIEPASVFPALTGGFFSTLPLERCSVKSYNFGIPMEGSDLRVFLPCMLTTLSYMSVFIPKPHCCDYHCFVACYRTRNRKSTNLFFFSRLSCWFRFPWDFIWILRWRFLFVQKILGDLLGIALNL